MKTITNNEKEMDCLRISCLFICTMILKLDYSTIPVSALHQHLIFFTLEDPDNTFNPPSIGFPQYRDTSNAGLTNCDYVYDPNLSLYVMEHYPVMYNGQPLFGWLNLKIRKNDSRAPNMRWTFGQAQTIQTGQNRLPQDQIYPGQFLLTQFDEENAPTCVTGHNSSYPNITKKYYPPGYFATDPMPTVPYGFSYPASSSSGSGPTGMTLNWRMDFPFCGLFNKGRALYFRFHTISTAVKDKGCNYQFPRNRKIFFKEYVGGASDPDPPKKAQLDCTKSLAELQAANNLPKWIESLGELDIKVQQEFYTYYSCQSAAPCYASLCIIGQSKNGMLHVIHSCQPQNNTFWNELPEKGGPGTGCDCKKLNDDLGKNGISANSGIGKRVFSYRRGHGLFMIIGTLFFMTVSHFGAHFYKETFFNKRILNFHIWYTIHVNGSLMAFLAFFAGTFAGIAARLFFGYSRHVTGQIHVVLGWITIAIFLLVFVSSGFRMKSPTPRLISIFLHYLGGGFSYLLCILCLVSSCYIPASPSGRSDVHLWTSGFVFEYFFLGPLIAWIIFDIAISVVMNICMLSSDKRMKFKKRRKWACFAVCGVPIPMLRPYSKIDLDGAKCRKLLLVVYFLVASLMTSALVVVEMTSPTQGRFFGPMEYTHKAIGILDPKFGDATYFDSAAAP